MEIHGSTHIHGPHALRGPHTPPASKPAPNQASPPQGSGDQLDISPAAEAAIRAEESDEVRHDLVARIRHQIEQGTYDTPERLERALDRLLDELA